MSYYQIDTRNHSYEESLELFRRVLDWAAQRGDSFEIGVDTAVYDDPVQLTRLKALGEISKPTSAGDALTRFLKQKFDNTFITIRGKSGPHFIEEMTRAAAPEQVITGEQSPVDTIIINDGERALYVAYDYGNAQILDLHENEKAELIRVLQEMGHSGDILLPVKSDD